MFSKLSGIFLITALPMIFYGCLSVGPDYVGHPVTTPGKWHANLENGLAQGPVEDQFRADWWTVFNDPVLSDLTTRLVSGNLDLKAAGSRLQEARAKRGLSRSEAFPTLDAAASVRKMNTGSNSGSGTDRELYTAGFDAAWELDIFGGVRRSVEAADANVEAAGGDVGDVMVSLLAEMARNYVEMRAFQAKLAIVSANIRLQEETCRLAAWRLSAGLGNALELEQARYNLASTLSTRPSLQTGLEETKNRMAVLLGLPPGNLHQELEPTAPIPTPPENIAVGIPADVLRQRPDLVKAERELAAQTANIGVAAANQYPRFTLNGSIGLESLSAGNLFSLSSRTSSFGPQVVWSIFDGKAVKRNIEVQSAIRDQVLYQYESAVLNALEEVENALSAYSGERHRMASLSEAVRAAREAESLARVRYEAGLADFSTVLEAQRSLYSFESQQAESLSLGATDLIALYKALGGGWLPADNSCNPSSNQGKQGNENHTPGNH